MDTSASNLYTVVLWDYDGAPDAVEYHTNGLDEEMCKRTIAPYIFWKLWTYSDLKEAQRELHKHLDWYKDEYLEPRIAVGAALFDKEGVKIEGYGMTFHMPEMNQTKC